MMDFKRAALDIASFVGAGDAALSLYDSLFGIKDFTVDPAIKSFELSEDERKGYVYFPLLPGYASWSYIAALLGSGCYYRGYEPVIVTCSDAIEPCPAQTINESNRSLRNQCTYFGREIPARFGLTTQSIDDFLPDEHTVPDLEDTDIETYSYRGINLSRPARASCRKYLQRYSIDLTDERTRKVYLQHLRTAIRLVDASENVFDAYDISGVVTYEPLYVHGAIPILLARNSDIPGRTVGTAFRDSNLLFGNVTNRQPHQHFTEFETISEFLETPLTETQQQRVTELMENRATGAGVTHHFSATTDKSVDASDTSTVAGMFTNLLWDASLEPDEGPYADFFEWIGSTIDQLAGRDDVELILKTHPAEAARGTNQSVEQWVREAYSTLPENVTLLPADTDVNTYELIRDLDVGVVYNSTVGLEMAFRGYPVLVGGDTHYRGCGFTHDPETKSEYRACLDSLGELEATRTMRERAERYAYHLLVRKHIPFPFFSSRPDAIDYVYESVQESDVEPGAEPFDRIVEGIVADTPILSE